MSNLIGTISECVKRIEHASHENDPLIEIKVSEEAYKQLSWEFRQMSTRRGEGGLVDELMIMGVRIVSEKPKTRGSNHG